MSERYQKVFGGEENLYVDNAPIVILASALLKDTQTGKMIAQLKMQNMSGKKITYVKASITQLDAVKNVLGSAVEFEYLDLSIADKEEFGSKKPLPLPNSSTRSFNVGITHVGFADGTVWTYQSLDWKAADGSAAVIKAIEIEKIYQEALRIHNVDAMPAQQQAKELFERIQKDKDVSIEIGWCNDKIEQLKQQVVQQAVKRKKAIKISCIAAVALVVLSLLGYFVGYPYVAMLNGDYSVYMKMYDVTDVTILNGTTTINKFTCLWNLTSVTIPDSVTTIGDGVFRDSDYLTSVTIPDSVTTIGAEAFAGCTALTSITIPDSVTTIGDGAFAGCESLTSIVIPDGVTTISEEAFYGCHSLTSIVIPDSVTTICDGAFYGCESLTSVVIPDGVTTIGEDAFGWCNSLTSIVIPDSVTTIGEYAFVGCDGFTSFTIPDSVISVGAGAFKWCKLTSIVIPDSVTYIGEEAFYSDSRPSTVYYTGSQDQWKKIFIGDYNSDLVNSKIIYNYKG